MFKIRSYLGAFLGMLMTSSAYAQSTDYSLSNSGWTNGPAGTTTYTGTQTINASSNIWAISPYTGSTMVGLTPTAPTATFNAMTTALGMSSTSSSALSAEIAAQNPSGGGNITNAAWIYKDFPLVASTKFSMYWVYTSTDYVPFNDGSITTFVNTGDAAALGKINNVLTQYILLGATNPGTGNYSTGSYGSTGWQIVNYEVLTDGTYRLGFASFNQGDTALSPVLYVNDGLGTVTKNGQTFGAVAPNNPDMPTVGPVTPSNPTVVSTTPTTPTVTSTTTLGTSTPAAGLIVNSSTNTGSQFNVTQTTTPVTATPYTITTVTTPKVIQTWSDNTTTTITDPNNPATTTTQTGITYQFGNSTSTNQSASSATLSDAIKYNSNFPFIVDAISTPDGTWTVPSYSAFKANGKYAVKGFSGGIQRTVENNTFGTAFNISSGSSNDYLNSSSEFDSYSGSAYLLTRQPFAWIKVAAGGSYNSYKTNTSIPAYNLKNSSEIKQSIVYGDLVVYSAKSFNGLRPFFGTTFTHSKIDSYSDNGTPLLSTIPNDKSTNRTNPYVGLRYEYDNNVSAEIRATQTKDYKTVVGVKATMSRPLVNNVKVFASVGHDRGHNYNNTYGMMGLKVAF